MEISFLNNIKKYSSVNDKTGIANVMNEAFREAEKFKNLQLKVDSENISELEENEFYFHEIIGCRVFDENNMLLGEVVEILTPGANDVWVIKGENGKEILIPYIADVVKNVDVQNKKIDIEIMEGLID